MSAYKLFGIGVVVIAVAIPAMAQDRQFSWWPSQDNYRPRTSQSPPGYLSYLPHPAYDQPRYERLRDDQPLWFSVRPRRRLRVERPRVRTKIVATKRDGKALVKAAVPKPVSAPPSMLSRAKNADQIANPLSALLQDPTLRAGDIVVFADGPRLFRGHSGDKHSLTNFVEPRQLKLSAGTRKALMAMRIGTNVAWNAESSETKVAETDIKRATRQ